MTVWMADMSGPEVPARLGTCPVLLPVGSVERTVTVLELFASTDQDRLADSRDSQKRGWRQE